MNTPFTSFGYAVTNGQVTRTTPDRFADVVNVGEYTAAGGVPIGTGADDTPAFRQAISDAFGVCSFVGDTGGVLSTTLNVTAVNYGTIKPGRTLFLLGGQVIGTIASNVITYVPGTLAGTVFVGQLIADQINGVLGSNSVITAINTTTHQITYTGPTVTVSTAQAFNSFTVYPSNGNPSISGGSGGVGTYTLSQAMNIAVGSPLWCSNGQSHPELNKPLSIPGGNYNTTAPIIFMGITNPIVYGNGTVSIQYGGLVPGGDFGSSGNPVTPEPSFFPIFLLSGVNGGTFENISFGGSPTFGYNGNEPMVKLVLTATASVGATTLTFASATDPLNNITPQPNMVAWDIIDGKRLAGVVASVTSTTVTLRADGAVKNNSIPANSTIVFTPSVVGLMMDQSFGTGYCGGIKYRSLSFSRCGRGLFTNGGFGNCDNCSLDECFFSTCTIAGLQLQGANVLNWQSRGGGAASCGHASTCDPAMGPSGGNFGAAYSLVSCGCQIDSTSCSANTWDVTAYGTQGVTINAGRGEQMGIAPYLSEFTGYVTAGTPTILTVTAFTRGQALQPGTIISPTWTTLQSIGGFGVNGAVYITGPAASGGGSGGVGNYNLGTPGSFSYASSGSPVTMATPGIGRGQSIATDSVVTINNFGFGSGVPGLTNGEESRALQGGQFILNGFGYGPQGLVNAGWFVNFVDSTGTTTGSLVSNTTQFGAGPSGGSIHAKIGGGAHSRVFMINDNMNAVGLPPHLFDSFTGKVFEFSPWFAGQTPPDFTVAMLTTTGTAAGALMNASAIWSNVRLYVTDYTVAWGSGVGAVGTSIVGHGGGSHVVPVICPDGSGWVVSG